MGPLLNPWQGVRQASYHASVIDRNSLTLLVTS